MRQEVRWQETVAALASLPVLFALLAKHPGWPGHVPELVVWMGAAWVVQTFFAPLHVFAHELGHALTAVALTPQRVTIEVGSVENPLTFSIGRIDVRLCLWQANGGLCRMSLETGRLKDVLITLAGPLASGALAVGFGVGALAALDAHPLVFLILGIAAVDAFLGFLNLVPRRCSSRCCPAHRWYPTRVTAW